LKEIDRAKNGYVTTTELDDILKLNFPFLLYKNLKRMLKPFLSIQNKIIVDYRKFREAFVKLEKDIPKE